MLGIIIYMLLFLVVATLYRDGSMKIRDRNLQIILSFLLLFLFFGFRGLSVLNDTNHYFEDFESRLSSEDFLRQSLFHYDMWERFEYGYLVFIRFIGKYIWKDPYSIVPISSFIITIGVISFVSRYSNRIGLVLFLSFCVFLPNYYSAIRQGLAITFFFVAYSFLEKNKYITYIIFVLLAFLFHKSAIVLFLLIPIKFLDFNKRNILLISIIAVSALIYLSPLLEVMELSDSVYVNDNQKRETLPIAHGINILTLLFIVECGYIVSCKGRLFKPTSFFSWMIMLEIIFQTMSLYLGIIERYAMYFSFFSYLYLIQAYDASLNHKYLDLVKRPESLSKSKNVIGIVTVCLFIRMVLQLWLKNEWNHLWPYSFYY